MSNSSNNSRSNKARQARLGSKENTFGRLHKFVTKVHDCSDPEKELALARKICEFKGAQALLLGSQAITDVASRHAGAFGSDTAILFAEAGALATKAKNLDQVGIVAVCADKLMTDIPLRLNIAEGILPTLDTVEQAHGKNIQGIDFMFSVWDKVKSSRTSDSRTLKGAMSERATELLLTRYAIQTLGNGWVPVQSTLSEDHGPIVNASQRTGWDLSIFTEGDRSDPIHRIQVKTRKSENDQTYVPSDDFSIVHVSELRAHTDNPAREVLPQYILNELQRERETDSAHCARNLDLRTELLLDMFS